MTAQPLQPWIGIKSNGTIICAYCNCMVGLGEACSHIAATLYAVMAGIQLQQETSCTSIQCQWLAPSTTKQVETLNCVIFNVLYCILD